jgi:hypothetical protein
MSEAAVAKRRDWLSELRKAEGGADIDGFTDLLTIIAVEAPELKEPASAIAKGFGEGDPAEEARWQEWAGGFFIYPKAQPREESKAGTQPVQKAAPALVVKRRKIPGTPKEVSLVAKLGLEELFAAGKPKAYKTHAELKAEIEAEQAKAPEPEPDSKPEASTALVPVPNALVVSPSSPDPGEAIKTMNDKHAVISNLGGKCVVMEWVPSMIMPGAKELSYQSFTSFRERYANQWVDHGGAHGRENKAVYWLTHPQRRQYEGLDLVPNGPAVLPGGHLNLWRGWGVEPRKGSWRLIQRHIAEVLANGNQEFENYLKKWTAWKFQNPGLPPEAALALLGGKGAGKGAWGYTLMLIFGQHGLQIYASEHLTGKHNAHLQNKLYLFLDEAIWAGDKEADRKLKTLTTEKWLMIEPKGINSFQWVNRLGLYMSGNDKWIVPASHDERRYAVNRINERWKQDKSYFTPLFAEINNGGAAAMLYDLLNLDLDGWHPREHVPQTKALLDQKMLGMTGLEQWYVHLLSVGELPRPNPKNPRWVMSETLIEDAKNHGPRNKYITPEELAQFVKEMGCTHKSNGKKWGWIFPPLAEARAAWLARAGNTWEWLADIEDWGEKPALAPG